MVLRERTENGSTSFLNGTITDVVTTVAVADGSLFSASPQFRIIIDAEVMLVTGVAGNNFTVVRGSEGTTASAHTDGAVVAQIITRDGLREYITQNAVPMFGNTARPPAVVQDVSGTDLIASNFTAFNIGTATVTNYTGGHGFGFSIPPSAVNSLRGWSKSAPAAPWKLTVWGGVLAQSNNSQFVIGAKETGLNAVSAIANRLDGFFHQAWTTPTTFGTASSTTLASGQPYGFWLQVEDDNVNLTFRAGQDGTVWRQVHQEARLNTLSSVDEIFFGGNDFNNDFGVLGAVYAWIEE